MDSWPWIIAITDAATRGPLMWFALTIAVRLSDEIGCFGVITHPIDDTVRDFYCRFGFEALPSDPQRSLIVRMADLKQNGFGGDLP